MTTTEDALNVAESEAAHPVRFEDLGLSETVLKAVHDLQYRTPTPVQAAAIPEVLAGRDLLAAAQTGTGKTAAFLLPALNNLGHVAPRGRDRKAARGRGPLMLIVTPTRELAQQIDDVCTKIAARTKHIAVTVVGGLSYNPQKSALKRGCDVLVATPGRLVDLINQDACHLDEVRVLVLDEADRMLDMGFLPDVRKIVAQTPDDRQTLLFSATLDEKAVGAITDLVHDPARVEIAPATATADTVDQYVLPVSTEAKNALLAEVLKREGAQRVIVFTRTKHRADACCRRLARAGIKALPIHGNRSQAQRERALAAFRKGEADVLVATDVLARGIDITDVRYVVNFDVPEEPTDYIHRIGRTGRAGEVGWALTFVTSQDVDEFYDIEALMGKTAALFDARGLPVGEQPPAVDPERVPAARTGKKKTKRGKSTSKRCGGSAGGCGGEGAGRGDAPRPARPKRSGKARVRATDDASAPAGSAGAGAGNGTDAGVGAAGESAGGRGGARAARGADASRAMGSHRSRGGAARRGGGSDAGRSRGAGAAAAGNRGANAARSGRGQQGRRRTEADAAHDWRNADFVDERRGRGGRSGRAGGRDNRASYGAGARGGRGAARGGAGARGAGRATRRPGDRGGSSR